MLIICDVVGKFISGEKIANRLKLVRENLLNRSVRKSINFH